MRRRHYLASLPALLAGCLDQSSDDPSSPTPSPTTSDETPTPTVTPEPTPEPFGCDPTLTRPDASSLSRHDVESAIEEVDPSLLVEMAVPEFGSAESDQPEEYVISHPEPPDEPIVGVVEPTVGTVPGEVEFTIHNHSDQQFSFNPAGPSLWRAGDGTWSRIGPREKTLTITGIEPGETYSWTFDLKSAVRGFWIGGRGREIGGVGPGVYAFVIDGTLEEPDEPFGAESGGSLTVVAIFGLAGDPLTVEPEPAIAEDDGVARVPSEEDDETEELLIEPVEDADGSLTLEQAAQPRHLVRGLPYLFCEELPEEIIVEVPEHQARGVVANVGLLAGLEDPREGPTRISLLNESFELSSRNPDRGD